MLRLSNLEESLEIGQIIRLKQLIWHLKHTFVSSAWPREKKNTHSDSSPMEMLSHVFNNMVFSKMANGSPSLILVQRSLQERKSDWDLALRQLMNLLLLLAVLAVDAVLVAASPIIGGKCVDTADVINAELVIRGRFENVTFLADEEVDTVTNSVQGESIVDDINHIVIIETFNLLRGTNFVENSS